MIDTSKIHPASIIINRGGMGKTKSKIKRSKHKSNRKTQRNHKK